MTQDNTMSKTTSLIIIFVFLIAGLIGNLLSYFDYTTYESITSIVNGIARGIGIILLIQHLSFKRTRPYFQLFLGFMCIFIIGILFKFSHWPYSNIILTMGLMGLPTTYIIRFIKKQNKKRLDILKVLWVTLIFTMIMFSINHWPYLQELLLIENLLFLMLIIDFLYQRIHAKRQYQSIQ